MATLCLKAATSTAQTSHGYKYNKNTNVRAGLWMGTLAGLRDGG